LFFGGCQRGQQQRRQNGDDDDDHQQLYQSEGALGFCLDSQLDAARGGLFQNCPNRLLISFPVRHRIMSKSNWRRS
jgi:hypothetical protein